ncbi:ice-binding family protein [Streptomyces sp. NBC_00414]|uniref:ice-binding family protein n=1 Tax=Streptomyces sp. NBC_00414 TaxID=2975739 RepID=UPI002E212848
MTLNIPDAPMRRTMSAWIAAVTAVVLAAAVLAMTTTRADAIATPVPLGTAGSFAVLAGAEVTNTGPSQITGDLGVHPGTAITGFPPGIVLGTQHSADAVAAQAKSDLVAAYNDAAGQATDAALPPDAGGLTLVPGVYTASSTLGLTGTLTLDAQGDPNAVWVFQVGSGLTTASASRVLLVNGASPCNVYWKVGSSATLGTDSTFVGTILALTSISVTTGASIDGRALARNGAVTLDTNVINRGTCTAGTGGTTGGATGGLVSGGLIAGATTGGTTAGTTGNTTVGVIGGVPTGGGTGGTTGGLLGGVLTSGGTTGGVLGGLIAGATSGGATAGAPGGSTGGAPGGSTGGGHGGSTGGGHGGSTGGGHGGSSGGNGHDHHGQKPGKPGHDHHGGHDGKPGDHGHGHGKPDDHGGHDGHGGKPGHEDGYGDDHKGRHEKAA